MLIDIVKRWKWWLFGIIFVGGLLSLFQRWRTYQEHSQDTHILAAAKKYGVDAALVKAVVWRESRFNPRAKGSAGEIGLMQLREEAAGEWAKAEKIFFFTHSEMFDPAKNTQAGTWYLRKLLARYANTDNAACYALADYNAGRTHVLRWKTGAASTNSEAFLRHMNFPGTRKYVEAVVARQKYYQRKFPKDHVRAEGLKCSEVFASAEGTEFCQDRFH
jgi:soluble lytic murein transglycosylase